MVEWNMDQLDISTLFADLQQRQAWSNWVATSKDYLNKLRQTYAGSTWTETELNQISTGEHIDAIKDLVNFQKWEPYRVVAQEHNQKIIGTSGGREVMDYFSWASGNFVKPEIFGAWMTGGELMQNNIHDIQSYLDATTGGQAIEPAIWDHWQRNLGGIGDSGELAKMKNYNDWRKTYTAYNVLNDPAIGYNSSKTITSAQVDAAINYYGTLANFENKMQAEGKARQVSNSTMDFMTRSGVLFEDIKGALAGEVGKTWYLKEMKEYEDFNPVVRANTGKDITNITDLRGLVAKHGTANEYSQYQNGANLLKANRDMVIAYETAKLTDRTKPPTIDNELWTKRFGGLAADSEQIMKEMKEYDNWNNAYLSYGDAAPSLTEIAANKKQYGTIENFQNAQQAEGKLRQLGDSVRAYLTASGVSDADIQLALLGNPEKAGLLKEISDFQEMNTISRIYNGTEINSKEQLQGIMSQYGDSKNYETQMQATAKTRQLDPDTVSFFGRNGVTTDNLRAAYSGDVTQAGLLTEIKNYNDLNSVAKQHGSPIGGRDELASLVSKYGDSGNLQKFYAAEDTAKSMSSELTNLSPFSDSPFDMAGVTQQLYGEQGATVQAKIEKARRAREAAFKAPSSGQQEQSGTGARYKNLFEDTS